MYITGGHSCTCNIVIIHVVLNAIMNPYYTHIYEKQNTQNTRVETNRQKDYTTHKQKKNTRKTSSPTVCKTEHQKTAYSQK